MGGLEINRWRYAMRERIFPSRHANTPFIARLETGEIPFRMRRHEIVAIEDGEIEKLARHLRANRMQPDIAGTGSAKAIAIKASERIAAATLQFSAEDIRWHFENITFVIPSDSRGIPRKLP
jgi:hypothetical protein